MGTTDHATPPPTSHHLVLRPQVLELRKGSIAQARSNFQASQRIAPYMFESFFNGALLAYKLGNHQESYKLVSKSLQAYPNHSDSKDLQGQLKSLFTML